jgi:glutamate/tyrosine decarboxylase-like PLP-dependent enzyme
VLKTVIHKAFISAAGHYFLMKSASLLGLGENMFEKVVVDLDSRMSIASLSKKLTDCLRKKVPVLAVVGIAGTT